MPKRLFTSQTLPQDKPDCCAICPLCGIVPKNLRQPKSYETHVCLGTMEAMTQRFINVRSSNRDSHHPLKRPCDSRWDAWQQLPDRKFPISTNIYIQCRVPFESTHQLVIKFHK